MLPRRTKLGGTIGKRTNGTPSFATEINYRNFPKSVCNIFLPVTCEMDLFGFINKVFNRRRISIVFSRPFPFVTIFRGLILIVGSEFLIGPMSN